MARRERAQPLGMVFWPEAPRPRKMVLPVKIVSINLGRMDLKRGDGVR